MKAETQTKFGKEEIIITDTCYFLFCNNEFLEPARTVKSSEYNSYRPEKVHYCEQHKKYRYDQFMGAFEAAFPFIIATIIVLITFYSMFVKPVKEFIGDSSDAA